MATGIMGLTLQYSTVLAVYLSRFYSDSRLVANGFHLCQRIGNVYDHHLVVCFMNVLSTVHGQAEIELVSLHKHLKLKDLQETLS